MPSLRERLLFVDDEELVLRGMRRILLSHQDQWDMVFVNSGREALRLLAQEKFDTIISDIRMPGMNGAELLTEVARLYPATIRLVLSGYADRELMLQCVGVVHQYLAKPCDAAVLEAVLSRLANLVRSKKDKPIRQVLARCPILPSVSEVYSRLVEMLNDSNATIEEIGNVVAQDVALTAQVLKLANSAFYGLGRKMLHPGEAAQFLGIDTIKYMVLVSNLFQSESSRVAPGFSGSRLWTQSLACADAAKSIAEAMGGDRHVVNEAFVAGLLHDIGRLLLCVNLPEKYGQVVALAQRQRLPLVKAELEVFGTDHAELGGYYLGLLGLPVPVVNAVTFHHDPPAAGQESILLTAVHIGAHFAEGKNILSPGAFPSQLDHFITSQGLQDKIAIWRQNI